MPFSWRNLLTGIPTDKQNDIFDKSNRAPKTTNKRYSKQQHRSSKLNNNHDSASKPPRNNYRSDYDNSVSVDDLSAALGRASLVYDDPFSNYSRRGPPYDVPPPRHPLSNHDNRPHERVYSSSSVHPEYYQEDNYDYDYDYDYSSPYRPPPPRQPVIRPSASAPRLSYAPRISSDSYGYYPPSDRNGYSRAQILNDDRRHSSSAYLQRQQIPPPPPTTEINSNYRRRPSHSHSHSISTYLPDSYLPPPPSRVPYRTTRSSDPPAAAPNNTPPRYSGTATPSPRRDDQIRPNQCHGTTASGKRCLRTVGPSDQSPTKSSPSKRPPQLHHDLNNDHDVLADHTRKKLDRMLSRRGGAARRPINLKPPYTLPPPPIFNPDGDEAHDEDSSDEGDGEELGLELAKFCHQHTKQALREEGTFAGRRGMWVRFDDWIPSNLPIETILQLRQEMTRPVSSKDRVGYLYCHEMATTAADKTRRTTLIKVGRSVKPVARLSQWKSQCPSNRPIVRDIFPLHPSDPRNSRSARYHDHNYTDNGGSRLAGALSIAPEGCPYNFRWERLVLIEVAGRTSIEMAMNSPGGDSSDNSKEISKCADCGKRHAEHFEVLKGSYERWIMNVILKWQAWVSNVIV